MKDCIFCKIINKEIKANIIFEDEKCIVIEDINKKAPVHCLMIPKNHYALLSEMSDNDAKILGEIFALIPKITKKLELFDNYKLAINQGKGGGQEVFHLHIHIMGKKV